MTQLLRPIISLLVIFAACSTCDAFRVNSPKQKSTQRMAVIRPDLPGQVDPLGFFDPWGLSVGTTEKIFKRWQESEIKHGRVAMIAVVGILVSESYHPLFGGEVTGPAINYFGQIGSGFWLKLVSFITLIETYSIFTAWAPRKDTKGTVGWLREKYTPGDLGFDPLGLGSKFNSKEIRTKELQNGRLAMIAVAGIVAQELVNGQTVLGNLLGSQ